MTKGEKAALHLIKNSVLAGTQSLIEIAKRSGQQQLREQAYLHLAEIHTVLKVVLEPTIVEQKTVNHKLKADT